MNKATDRVEEIKEHLKMTAHPQVTSIRYIEDLERGDMGDMGGMMTGTFQKTKKEIDEYNATHEYKICSSCGAEIPSTRTFCSDCIRTAVLKRTNEN